MGPITYAVSPQFALTLVFHFLHQMADYLEDFLEEQVRSIKEISDYITNLKRVGTGLGEYMFDKESLS